MTSWIVRSSTRFRLAVVLIAAVIMSFGVVKSREAPIDVLPEFTAPYVEVQTEALGLSAVEVEQLITSPMEADLLNGVAFLEEIRSLSVPGLSSIQLYFEEGTDVLRARQMVQERLTEARALPNVSKAPVMIQPLSSTGRVMMVGLSSKSMSLIELSVLARWKIKPKLMGVPGVANVAVWGQRERQLQVQVDPERLQQNGVTLNQVVRTTANSLWVSPLSFVEASTPGTGGFVDTPQQRLGIQHVLPITTAGDLARVSLDGSPAAARLGDVATVTEDHQPLIGDAFAAGGPHLMLVIEKFPGASTLDVTHRVEQAMRDLAPGLQGVEVDTRVYRPAGYIEDALGNLGLATLLALLLLVAALGLLNRSWRVALIGLVTVPVSLAAALTVLHLRGTTLNSMVLAGLVVGLGVVVDSTVTEVDNIRQRRRNTPGGDADAVVQASSRLRSPIVFATLIALLAATPLLAISDVAGAVLRPFVLTYMLAVLASLAVALTLTPALAVLLLRSEQPAPPDRAPLRWLQRGYARLLPGMLRRPVLGYLALAALLLAGLALLPGLTGGTMLPQRQDRDLLVRWTATPGTSLPAMRESTAALTRDLRALSGVRGVGAHVGRAVTSDQVVGIHSGELWVSVRPSAPYQSTVADVRRVIRQHQGPELDVAAYPEQRMTDLGQRLDEPIVVRVYGDELPTLRARAEDVRRWLAATDGVVNPQLRTAPEEQTVQVEVDLARAQRFGLKPGDVRRAAATLISGIQVGSIFEEQKIFDVIVVGIPGTREGLDDIRALLIDTPNGQRVRLEQVADVRVTPAPTVYEHHSVSRFIDVTADVRGRSVDAVGQDVEVVLGGLLLPVGYHAVLLGEYEEARGELITVLVLGAGIAAVIFLLLQAAFQSWRLASVLFAAALAALVGGAAIALAGPGTPARSALLALLAVLGLTVRQAVLLVARWERMDRAPDGRPDPAEAQRAAVTGLVPVVTTAVVLAAAMLPFVVLGRGAGLEMARSLAVVTLGGLVTSTLVILFILPPLYLRHAPVRPVGTPEPPPPAGVAAPPTVPEQRLDERLAQRRELTDATP